MIPNQADADLRNPEEHFAWALKNMPAFAGAGLVTHPAFIRQWSSHLWNCGFAHRDYLESLADKDGNIHVSKLPRQVLKYQQPVRGPRHGYNNAGRWVTNDTPDPAPINLPDIRHLTIQENEVMLEQYRSAGMIPPAPAEPSKAEVLP